MKLRLIASVILLAMIASMLSGCKRTDYAENKAYAVMLGVDLTDDNNVKLTIRYPKLAGNTGGSGGESGSSYGTGRAEGKTFQQALDTMRIKIPNNISLSALTMVVLSKDVLDSKRLEHILDGLTANYRMYSSAYIAVCDGEASQFIEKQEPQLGSRLSENLKALVENSGELGNIPESRLADVYYRMNSVYSAPAIMRCYMAEESEGGNGFAGAYVVSDKGVVALDREQAMLANVLIGNVKQFMYSNDEMAASLTVESGPKIRIDRKNGLNIGISMEMSGMLMNSGGSMGKLAQELREEMLAVAEMFRDVGMEPFGFADRAAAGFNTMDEWIEYEWAKRFSDCELEIDIVIREVF